MVLITKFGVLPMAILAVGFGDPTARAVAISCTVRFGDLTARGGEAAPALPTSPQESGGPWRFLRVD